MAVARIQSMLFLADPSRARLPGEPGYIAPEEGEDEPAGEPTAEDDDDNNDVELTDADALPNSPEGWDPVAAANAIRWINRNPSAARHAMSTMRTMGRNVRPRR